MVLKEILDCSSDMKKRLTGLFVWILAIFTLLLNGCSRQSPAYWPANGATFQNITWEIPVEDSSRVLVKLYDHWILPEPTEDVSAETTLSIHRIPEIKGYSQQLGRVDQEVVNGNAPLQVEFYRFEKGSVQFLGHMNPDETSPLLVYDPPLILFPSNMDTLPFSHESEGVTQTWNAETERYEEGYQNRIRLELEETGLLLLDSTEVIGLLCEMTLSSDRTVGFGETDLIVPDAVMLQSQMVIVEGFGPVLEWGYRSREVESSDEVIMQIEQDAHKEREIYIEVTRHQKVIE